MPCLPVTTSLALGGMAEVVTPLGLHLPRHGGGIGRRGHPRCIGTLMRRVENLRRAVVDVRPGDSQPVRSG